MWLRSCCGHALVDDSRSARTAVSSFDRPCSHFCTVRTLNPYWPANCACVSPSFSRSSRTSTHFVRNEVENGSKLDLAALVRNRLRGPRRSLRRAANRETEGHSCWPPTSWVSMALRMHLGSAWVRFSFWCEGAGIRWASAWVESSWCAIEATRLLAQAMADTSQAAR